MKNNITEIVFILDRSGSMEGLEADTIGGFNSMIQKQKDKEGKALISTFVFNNYSKRLHDREDIQKVRPLTEADYQVGGCTALLDAIGDAVTHIGNIHKYARKEDIPAKTLVVIMTDGMENASYRHSAEQIRRMIRRQQSKYGWEFLFLGANIDAVETAGNFGIDKDHAVDYYCDEIGTRLNYEVLSEVVASVRSSGRITPSWKKRIHQDYNNRSHS